MTILEPEDAVRILGSYQYDTTEIQQMIDDQLPLNEVANKLSTLGDVFQYLNQKGFYSGNTPMIGMYWNGFKWNAMNGAHRVFETNWGCCSDGSALLNYLLQGNYDEQGYVQEVNALDRHVFNWFCQDGVYYFVDWTEIIGENNMSWRIYATEKPQIFADYDVKCSQESERIHEIYLQYLYPQEGTPYPIGVKRDSKPFIRTLPSQIADSVLLLYENPEICRLEFREGPPEENWPSAARNP